MIPKLNEGETYVGAIITPDGTPGHPLYIGYDVKPQEWKT